MPYHDFPNSDAIYIYFNESSHSILKKVKINENFTYLNDLSYFSGYNVCAKVCEKPRYPDFGETTLDYYTTAFPEGNI